MIVDPDAEILQLRSEVDAMWIAMCALGALTGHDGHLISTVLEKVAENLPADQGRHLNALAHCFRAGFDGAVAARPAIGEGDVHG